MKPVYEQLQDTWPTTLKNLVSAYIIVNKLQLVVPADVLAADYRVTGVTADIDIAWIGKWFSTLHWLFETKKECCCFVRASQVPSVRAKIKQAGPNTITVHHHADTVIEELDITKCRYEPPDQVTVDKLFAVWDTYCYFTETDQLDKRITMHLLRGEDYIRSYA